MLDLIEKLEKQALSALETTQNQDEIYQWKVTFLGRSSKIANIFEQVRNLAKEERPLIGKRTNRARVTLETAMQERETEMKNAELNRQLAEEKIDVTMPGKKVVLGRHHPVTQTLREIYSIFGNMGFQIYRSREVETDIYNFQLLNFPPHHPARDLQDSFYVSGSNDPDDPFLLRTHTSPGQIRAMREYSDENPDNPPPVRLILPGMCYRYEQITARAEIQFTQVEGLAIGTDITFANLKGTLQDFAQAMFGEEVGVRFRASHFPFTEPSAEMDIECFVCEGEGCPVCKSTGWLEILGCGMVHPVVLQNGGYDPEKYTGFAFGMGPERITMLKHRIDDIRNFWKNDLRFLGQF